jgi:hypothetical protein
MAAATTAAAVTVVDMLATAVADTLATAADTADTAKLPLHQ